MHTPQQTYANLYDKPNALPGRHFGVLSIRRDSNSPLRKCAEQAQSILKQTGVTAASAIVQAAMITPAVKMIYPEVSGWVFALTVLLNSSVFPLMLGTPLMILMHEELGFKPKPRLTKIKA